MNALIQLLLYNLFYKPLLHLLRIITADYLVPKNNDTKLLFFFLYFKRLKQNSVGLF